MHTFLEDVAGRLYEKYGDDISSLSMFLPSKRARHFFADALARRVEHPVWSPHYSSIDELMGEAAGLHAADHLTLLSELYAVYLNHHPDETFDKFYQWGELLLSDFDMIDKYQVDAAMLYLNISELKEIEANVDYLTDSQKRVISSFWGVVYGDGESMSVFKERFLTVWRSLGAIYEEYRARLVEQGIGYTGMIYRRACERLQSGEVKLPADRRYVFAGFNALSTCERYLFGYVAENCTCDFFWDYDAYYVNNKSQEAGLFVRKSLSELPSEGFANDTMLEKSVTVASTSTNVAQCRYAVEVLRAIAEREGSLDKDTAVVLTDENLLMPLLYALPESLKTRIDGKGRRRSAINVTMGYPLRHTPAYSLVMRLLDLQAHARGKEGDVEFYHVDIEGLLSHPYIVESDREAVSRICSLVRDNRLFMVPRATLFDTPLLQSLFSKAKGGDGLLDYLIEAVTAVAAVVAEQRAKEYLAVIVENLKKLRNSLSACSFPLLDEVCRSLVRRALQDVRISFTGEPLEGLQIMGILESRNLDFRNVIILSMSDDNFPGTHNADQSFIPQMLRAAYNLPTPEHHDGVHAYYFYRLIQRAENVHLVYCSHADDKSSGEPSRYIHQLHYESGLKLQYVNVGVEVADAAVEELQIEKDEAVMARLECYLDGSKTLSPTALSSYISCPLQFYYRYVASLFVDEEMEETVDARIFGNIFHKAAEEIYMQIKGDVSSSQLLERFATGDYVERAVDTAIAKAYFNREDGLCPTLSGELLVVRDIVIRYLRDNVMQYDKLHGDFAVYATERKLSYNFPLTVDGRERHLCFEGTADRIDSLNNGLLRVIDYKTGHRKLEYAGLQSLFHDAPNSHLLNTWLYAMMIHYVEKRESVPALYYVSDMYAADYSPLFKDSSVKPTAVGQPYSSVSEEFEGLLRQTLEELYNRHVPFCRRENVECDYCNFKSVCGNSAR